MNKQALIQQLIGKLREVAVAAQRDLRSATEMEEQHDMSRGDREDARTAVGNGGLLRGQKRRAETARRALAAVEAFAPAALSRRGPVQLGNIVEIEDEETGRGRTLFLAPAGAGVELTGPDGDGFLSVVTPVSPVGRAAMGRRVGDAFDVAIAGQTRSWEITWVA
jgi:transcription elongation GreA/GreB family factor